MKIVLPAIILAIIMLTAAAGVDITYLLNKKLEQKQEDKKWEDAFIDKLGSFIAKLEDKARINVQDKTGNIKSTQKSFNKTTEITIENHPIKRIKINNATGDNTIKIGQPKIPDTLQTFAIDPTETKFTNGEIEIIAKGNQLYKCPTWNYTTEICEPTCTWDESEQQNACEPKWIYQKDITPGQNYRIEITPNDPAYLETSATPDVSIAPLTTETFIIAFIDAAQSDASYRIYNTNGTILLNTTDIDTTVDNISRIKVATLNATDFVIAYVDGPDNDLSRQIIRWNGSSATNITTVADIDTEIGDNTDVGIAVMANRYAVCNANQNDLDADYRIYNFSGTQTTGESNIDGSMGPETTLDNLVDCAGINASRWAYFHFDDTTVNDASFAIINSDGTIATAQTDIDTDVGETGRTAVTALAPSRFGMVWYDSTDQDITIAIRDAANTAILAATDIDTAAGTSSRVAATTVKKSNTDSTELLVAAWQDTSDNTIKAAAYYQNGTTYTAPFNVTTTQSGTYTLIDAIGRKETGLEICPGKFIVGYSNSSGQGEFKGYHLNGTIWDGVCARTASVSNVNPLNDTLITPTTSTIRISAEATGGTITNVTASIKLPNGSTTTINLLACGGGCSANEYNNTYTLPDLEGYYEITITANNTDGNAGTANTTILVLNPPDATTILQGNIGGTGATITEDLPQSINTDNSFIIKDSMTDSSSPSEWQWTSNITNSTRIEFTRYTGGTSFSINYQLVTGNGITTQRGTASLGTGITQANITINPVNLTNTFAIVEGRCDSGTGGDSHSGFFLARIINSTQLRLERGNAANCNAIASWQVVSWNRTKVISRSATKPGGVDGINVTIPNVNTSRSILLFGVAAIGIDSGLDTNLIQGNITSNTTILFQNLPGATSLNGERNIHYYVIEIPGIQVQKGAVALSANTNATIQAVTPTRALIATSAWNTGTGSIYLHSQHLTNITNETNLQFTKLSALETHNIAWQVAELYSRCPGTITQNTILSKDINTIQQKKDNCINIKADNIELNCNGKTITGNAIGTAIFAQNRNNITIKNCIINNFETNIKLNSATNSKFINNTLLDATLYSMNSTDSSNNQHINSTYYNQINGAAILQNSNNNTITNTQINSPTGNALLIQTGGNNTLANSTIKTNTGTAINLQSGNNNITNTTIEANETWTQTASTASGNILNNITFNSTNGSIRTLTQVTIPNNTIVNTAKLNTSFNLSFVNDTNLTFLNISSQITLRGLNFTNVTAIFDQADTGTFAVCMTPQCIFQSYNGSTFVFNVTGFSRYAAKERDDAPIIFPDTSMTITNQYLNDTVKIRANIISQLAVTNANITIKHPNGTEIKLNLTNLGNTTWETNYTNLTQRGRYNLTFYARDSLNNVGNETSFFKRAPLKIIDVIKPNSEEVPTLQNFSFINYTIQVIQNQSGVLDLSVNLNDTQIKQINITGHNENSPYSIIEIFGDKIEQISFAQYAINPEGINLTNATLVLNASGNNTLMKCADYNFTEQHCNEGNWIEHKNITKGQLYTVTINSTDPAFIETTAAGDVAMDPLDNNKFLIGFVDIANTDVSFEILYTNGTTIVAQTDVDTTVSTSARVDVNWINSSHFVIFWADTSSNDATFQIFSFNGTATTSVAGPIDVDTSMGSTNVDVSLAMLDNRFVTCYANDADSDADFQAYNFTGGQVVGETAVDGNIQPSSPLQNLIDCSATNNTRWTYFTFDDSTVNDATYYILDNTGGTIVGATDIDTDVGETGQVAVIGLNNNLSGFVWYDSTDQDISIAGVNNSNTTIFGPTDVDTGAGTESRVAAAAVRQNKTSTDQLFAFAWWSQSNATVKAAVYRLDGTQFTAPFNVSTTINSTYPIIDITGRDNITGQEICPGAFLVAFSNASTGQFVGYWVNGTLWNGTCPTDLIATNLTVGDFNPDELENVSINGTVFNNGTVPATPFVVSLVDGFNCTTGTQVNNFTISNLSAGYNFTVNFSWTATPVGPHNISFCVNYYNSVLEDNYTNNNITITINVKAYNDYYGNLTGNVTLDTNTNNTEYDWGFNDSGNVIFTTANKTINFSALYALGRNTSGGVAANDFLEADQALNMTGFNDSIQTLWATNASNPRQTTNFTVRGRTIENVPYINSTNTSNFITGILWQSANATSREFNATLQAPLLFVTMINRNQTGFYGTYDYEAHVPVLLRVYNSTANALQYFVELK